MIELKRTSSEDPDFLGLVKSLDEEMWKRYPLTQQNYVALNVLKPDTKAVVAYDGGKPVGCACFRDAGMDRAVEIKRMFVAEPMRSRGIAKAILRELEKWAAETGGDRAVLETGVNQPEALALYEKSGYRRIDNFGPFTNDKNSICMEKRPLKLK